jgi:acetate kinase
MTSLDRRVLTINGGSSSINFVQFQAGDSLQRVLEGAIEQIGQPESTQHVNGVKEADSVSRFVTAPDHLDAVGALMDWIGERVGRHSLTAVGHRVVHGGPNRSEPQLNIAEMIEELRRLNL